MKKFVLASASPRRKELLEQLGLRFDILVSNADESCVKNDSPELYVQELALLKATASYQMLQKNCYLISADTVVCLDGEILGKPKDRQDAERMLRSLSGNWHEVYTGFCIMRAKDGYTVCSHEKSRVKFFSLTDEIIADYLNTCEPYDKAGAYGIQGVGAVLVEKIEGDYNNIVGLPLAKLNQVFLKEFNLNLMEESYEPVSAGKKDRN